MARTRTGGCATVSVNSRAPGLRNNPFSSESAQNGMAYLACAAAKNNGTVTVPGQNHLAVNLEHTSRIVANNRAFSMPSQIGHGLQPRSFVQDIIGDYAIGEIPIHNTVRR